MEIVFEFAVKLGSVDSECLLNGLVYRNLLHFNQAEILSQLRHLVLLQEVVQENPGLRVE